MDIVLIPGFWLDGDSWSTVTPPLAVAGHRVHPLTLPGKEADPDPHAGIGLQTHIDAVVAELDALAAAGSTPVALVGHSGGAAIAWGAADARPELVGRLVFVDAFPLGDGSVVNDELPVEGDSVPLPAWDVFEEADLRDLDRLEVVELPTGHWPQLTRPVALGESILAAVGSA